MILLIDNYDSFVYNLARYIERLGEPTRVVRNDAIDPPTIRRMAPRAIVLSPGPCTPSDAGCSLQVVRELADELPMLGVCLGHQTIAQAFGASIVRAGAPMHGRSSDIRHDGDGLFRGTPNPLTVGRYHSLVVEPASLPSELLATAWTDDRVVMAIRHRRLPIFGVQFHPESVLTPEGPQLIANFLRLVGCDSTVAPFDADWTRPAPIAGAVPSSPVTF